HGACPRCGEYARMTAPERLTLLADHGSVVPLEGELPADDPLNFSDSLPYPRRLDDARLASGLREAVVCAEVTIGGTPAVIAIMDFRFLGGSLGAAVGEMITRAAELALRRRAPLVLVTASGGVRMYEGVIGLMQMVKTTQAIC